MDLRGGRITVGELLRNPDVRSYLQHRYPAVLGSPMLRRAGGMPLSSAITYARRFMPQSRINQILAQLQRM